MMSYSITDGCPISHAVQNFLYSSQVDKASGILHNVYRSLYETMQVL